MKINKKPFVLRKNKCQIKCDCGAEFKYGIKDITFLFEYKTFHKLGVNCPFCNKRFRLFISTDEMKSLLVKHGVYTQEDVDKFR